MFSIKANPKFEATLTIQGQGREQKLQLTFNHRPVTEYQALLQRVQDGETSSKEALLELVDAWDADMDLSIDTLTILDDEQPGAIWAVLGEYGRALVVARKGN